ncbi:hypothetical protein O1611_g811 [Lasiodiplodia mahajangana]|uniref:Uncharacterized protein n=1 Tax=Lasiodiplodia mahajangana TaxID=1108764 RepID=A0ACC2K032_9PEZI|nr:hypothetical protein O1611_g811 [Lasiodiplodia mahajangana]
MGEPQRSNNDPLPECIAFIYQQYGIAADAHPMVKLEALAHPRTDNNFNYHSFKKEIQEEIARMQKEREKSKGTQPSSMANYSPLATSRYNNNNNIADCSKDLPGTWGG